MPNKLFKKLLVIGIIVLFIGLAFIPSFNAVSISMLENHPPSPPQIKGPSKVCRGTHEWTFKSFDPDGDNVSYLVDWGDDTGFNWNGPHPSGLEVTISHTYTYVGSVTITACANDTNGAVSDLSTMPLWIYESKHISNQIQEKTDDCDCQSNGKTHLAEKLINKLEKNKVISNIIDLNAQEDDRPICDFLCERFQYYTELAFAYAEEAGKYQKGSLMYNIYGSLAAMCGFMIVNIISIIQLLRCPFGPYYL